jgi:hypothetical protein
MHQAIPILLWAQNYVYVRTLLCGLPCKLMAYRSRKLDYVSRTSAQCVFLHEGVGRVDIEAPSAPVGLSRVH